MEEENSAWAATLRELRSSIRSNALGVLTAFAVAVFFIFFWPSEMMGELRPAIALAAIAIAGVTSQYFWIAFRRLGLSLTQRCFLFATLWVFFSIGGLVGWGRNVLRIEELHQQQISKMLPSSGYVALSESVQEQIVEEISADVEIYNRDLEVDIGIQSGERDLLRIAQRLESILQSAGIEGRSSNPSRSMYLPGNSREQRAIIPSESKISIKCHPDNSLFTRELVINLTKFVRWHFDIHVNEKLEDDVIYIDIKGDPRFFADGTITFED